MDFKKDAAKKAVTFIEDGSVVGLGMGATMAYMVEFLGEQKKTNIQIYTPAASTESLLKQNGFVVHDISAVSNLDIYFDGCDQFDKDLNALKSGGGIHTNEKLFASMANEFVLVGDDSKYVEQLNTTFPLTLEILPQAVNFVMANLHQLLGDVIIKIRKNKTTNDAIITANNNHLIDVWFAKLPELSQINPLMKSITGVVETSLFYNMASKAIIAGKEGIKVIEKNKLI